MTAKLPILKTCPIDPDHPKHWAIGCSNASRWVPCPGSKYAVDEDDDGGFMAEIGTLGHKIVEHFLRAWLTSSPIGEFLTDADRILLARLDRTQLDWFKESIKLCVEATKSIAEPADEVYLETKLESKTIDNHGGTVDVILWVARERRIIVVDFKFGRLAVDCKDNYQVMAYLNLARQLYPKATRFEGVIIQPAYNGVDRQIFTRHRLNDFAFEASKSADPDNMERRGDPDWCEYCPLLTTCDAAAKHVVSAVDEFGTLPEFINTIEEWTPDRIERLERIVLMHKLATKAYAQASTLLKQLHADGHGLQYHRVTSSNYRSWKPSAGAELKALYGGDVVKESVMSPNELQNFLGLSKKEFDEAHFHMLELVSRPTLKAGVNPTAGELAADLPVFDESQR